MSTAVEVICRILFFSGSAVDVAYVKCVTGPACACLFIIISCIYCYYYAIYYHSNHIKDIFPCLLYSSVFCLLGLQVVQMHCNLESNEEGTKTHVSHIVLQVLCPF